MKPTADGDKEDRTTSVQRTNEAMRMTNAETCEAESKKRDKSNKQGPTSHVRAEEISERDADANKKEPRKRRDCEGIRASQSHDHRTLTKLKEAVQVTETTADNA